MKIGSRDLRFAPYLVAEAGSNHDGSYERARRLVVAAAEAGADAVKFQLFTLAGLFQPAAFERALGIRDPGWRAEVRKIEFRLAWLPRLARVAANAGIDFLCTPFDEVRLAAYLAVEPPAIKIASGDLTHLPLLRACGATRLPVLLSTGVGTEDEIRAALAATGARRTLLLDCVMRYPAAAAEYGLARLDWLAGAFRCPVGLSDHTTGLALPVLAVHRGACLVERHFTLDKTAPGGDHAMSADPAEFALFAKSVREAAALRKETGTRRSDTKERVYARRSMYALRALPCGARPGPGDVAALRPATGPLSPADWSGFSKRPLDRAYAAGDALDRPVQERPGDVKKKKKGGNGC